MLALLPPAAARPASAEPALRQPAHRSVWWLQNLLLLAASASAPIGWLVADALPLRLLAIALLVPSVAIALELLLMRQLRRSLPAGPAMLPADGSAARRLAGHRAAWRVVRLLLAPVPSPALRALALRLAGARVGRGTIIESLACFPDPHMVAIGAGAIIEERALVLGCDIRKNRLRIAPVAIGERALVCRSSVLRPAAVVACDAIVCASSEVGCSQHVGAASYHRLAAAQEVGSARPLPLAGG